MTQPSRAAVQDALRQAQMSFNQGNYSAAEPIYKQMVENIPPESEEYALCLHNLGEINEQRGNLTTAIWWQQRLISHPLMTHEGMVEHQFYRMAHIAALYAKAGRPSEANALYQQLDAMRSMLSNPLPPGFEPQSEVGTFLKGLFDAVHRKYASDQVEGEQTRKGLEQLHNPQDQPAQQSVNANYGQSGHGSQPEAQASMQQSAQPGMQQGQQWFSGAPGAGIPAAQNEQPAATSVYAAQPDLNSAAPNQQYDDGGANYVSVVDNDNNPGVGSWGQPPQAQSEPTDAPGSAFESRAQVRQAAKQQSKAEEKAIQQQQQDDAAQSLRYDDNALDNIPSPAKSLRPKPTAPKAKQQDISPAYLKKEEDPKAFISNQPRDGGPSKSKGEPAWEPPRRGKAPKALKPKKFKRDSITTDDDYAPKRRIGMTEADTLDSAPSEMDSNMQGMAATWTELSNSKNAPILFFGIIAIVAIIIFQMPYPGKPLRQFNGMIRHFGTIDGTKQFTLMTLTKAELGVNSTVQPEDYKFYFGDWREAVFLALGQLPEKQYWLTDKKTGMMDESGLMFYDVGGPERKLYAAMEAVSRAASTYYTSHEKKYPASGESIGAAELTYENPYTKQNSVADIQSLAIGDAATKAGDLARGDIYDKLSKGQSWQGEKTLTPGAINCLSAEITTSRGPIEAFFIQAADESGKPILSSDAGKSCYLALEDGKPLYAKSGGIPFFTDGTMRKRMVVILEKPIDSNFAYIVHNAACWLFTFLAFIAACVYAALPKRSGGKAVAIGFIVVFGIIATMYTISNRL